MNNNSSFKQTKIEQRLDDFEIRLLKLENREVEIKTPKKNISIREFLNEKIPEDDLQRTLFIGYYLENYEGLESFNKRDLEHAFEAARFKIPSNINVNVNINIEKGFIMIVKKKKDNLIAWVLTNSGIRFVENKEQKNGSQ